MTEQATEILDVRLERVLSSAFSAAGWTVEEQPVLGGARPDFIVTSPDNQPLVIEVKTGDAPVHFGAVAQAAELAMLAKSVGGHPSARAVVLATSPISVAADDAADRLGVLMLGPDEASDLEQLANRWVSALDPSMASKDRTAEDPSISPAASRGNLDNRLPASAERQATVRRKRVTVALVLAVIALVIGLGVVAVSRGEFSDHGPSSSHVEHPAGEESSPHDAGGGSSPIVPIAIAVVVLAAISIGVVMYRQRKRSQDRLGAGHAGAR
jgi:hypothetical protein